MKETYQVNPIIKTLKADARKNGTPIYAVFELTARCNFNCKMCYIHNMDNSAAKEKELNTAAWKSIFDQAISEGLLFALLTGGECLLREDFDELYLYLYERGVVVSVNTNAYLLDEEKVKFFALHKPERIQISMYGSDEDAYLKITERKGFTRFMNALALLQQYDLPYEIAVTPSKLMLHDFANILGFLEQNKISYRINPALIPARDGEYSTDLFLSVEEQIELARIKRFVRGKSEPIPMEAVPTAGGNSTEIIYGLPCNAGMIRYVITYDGKMIPCTAIPDISVDCIQNDLRTCWNYIHAKIMEVKQAAECADCVYKGNCILCPAIRYNGLFSGHCNENVCRLMEAECKAGLIKPKA